MMITLSSAMAAPANATPRAIPSKLLDKIVIVVPPTASRELIGKWPDAEVIADVAPQPVEAFRLDHQEEDDQSTEDDEAQIGDHVQQVGVREEQSAELFEEQARRDRQQRDEDRAEHRAQHR